MCNLRFLMLATIFVVVEPIGFHGANAQESLRPGLPDLGPYKYERKPAGEAFAKVNPRLAPKPGALLLHKGDSLAIVGDSITEQKMYSRLIETYLTACLPHMNISVRQFGWSGEKTDGFLRRMDNDCLRFEPDVVTLSYGMNDARYRPYDYTNARWYEDHYRAIVRKLKAANCRIVVGSPGCSGKLATWVSSRVGTLAEHNQHLCALRDVAMHVAVSEDVSFADVFWPMYKANVLAPGRYQGDGSERYELAGADGIHPGWAGHAIMAYAYLRALGLDGDLAAIEVDLQAQSVSASDGHVVKGFEDGIVKLTSSRYPFCAPGPEDRDDAVRSGMTFVPFDDELNRFVLKVKGFSGLATITWGEESRTYSAAQLESGINLAAEFRQNPFCEPFARVDQAVAAKQAFETTQVKKIFHGKPGRDNMEQAVATTEKQRAELVDAIQAVMTPVSHDIRIEL